MINAHPQLVAVGTIAKAFGIKGEVAVRLMTDSPARFRSLKKVWVGADSHAVTERNVERASVEARGVRLKLEGIDDRTAAEHARGLILFVDEADSVRPEKGRYFVHDVIGLFVRDEQGNELGTLEDVLQYPAHDIYVVRGGGREIQIPAVKEFITAIDIHARSMTVRLIEGMVE